MSDHLEQGRNDVEMNKTRVLFDTLYNLWRELGHWILDYDSFSEEELVEMMAIWDNYSMFEGRAKMFCSAEHVFVPIQDSLISAKTVW